MGCLLFVIISSFVACSRQAKTESITTEKETNTIPYLPSFLKDVYLGQAQEAVLAKRADAHVVNTLTATQWQQYTEDVNQSNLTSVYYDFEQSGAKRLVAVALLHKDEGSAEATFKKFGGSLVDNQLNERVRTGEDKTTVYALRTSRRVTFMLPVARPKDLPSNDR
jgi:hypothetical protein